MSGGAHEYISSYTSGYFGISGFAASTIKNYDSKYFDVYSSSSTLTSFQYRILGDATGETGPFKNYLDGDNTSRYHNSWYNDSSSFVSSNNAWLGRGGSDGNGVLAGQFQFSSGTGGASAAVGFRIVLAP